jgi:hypothetical protein
MKHAADYGVYDVGVQRRRASWNRYYTVFLFTKGVLALVKF